MSPLGCLRKPIACVCYVLALSALVSPTVGGAALLYDAPSQSEITVTTCNHFRTAIFVAFAYPEDGDWTSRGWMRIPSNACKNAQLPKTFSFRAESMSIDHGDYTSRNEWGGPGRFCVSPGRFKFHPAGRGCGAGRLAEFSRTHRVGGNASISFRADGRYTDVRW